MPYFSISSKQTRCEKKIGNPKQNCFVENHAIQTEIIIDLALALGIINRTLIFKHTKLPTPTRTFLSSVCQPRKHNKTFSRSTKVKTRDYFPVERSLVNMGQVDNQRFW